MTLKTCGKTGCNPIEQIRGNMKAGDYHDVIASHAKSDSMSDPHLYGTPQGSDEASTARAEHLVEMPEDGRNDFRIVCKTCGRVTPWNKSDAPGMPGVGKTFTRDRWNEMV